jgi:hypothetical protein
MKNIIRCLFGIPVILSVPIVEEKPIDKLLEGLAIHKDVQDCCVTCGYAYCPSLDDCIRPWETYCQEFDFPYNALYKGSGIILPGKKSKD